MSVIDAFLVEAFLIIFFVFVLSAVFAFKLVNISINRFSRLEIFVQILQLLLIVMILFFILDFFW